ncbi:MAG: nitroreductase [Dehalococcoidia bacterium]
MDLVEAIDQRKSIRAFKPDPVPRSVLGQIMDLALRAPSWANTQPWEFAIVTGEKLEAIRQAYVQKAQEEPDPDLGWPREYPEAYDIRSRALGRTIFEIEGIGRGDAEKRQRWQLQGLRLFEAPAAIYIYTDRSYYFQGDTLNAWPIFDCGLVAGNIMLLATKYGLGTTPQMQAVKHPDILRGVLGLPDSKLLVVGMAIGYPNWDDPINRFRTEREPLEGVANWYGFE